MFPVERFPVEYGPLASYTRAITEKISNFFVALTTLLVRWKCDHMDEIENK